jgi:multiple sugar transport system substrate-binding protein
VVFLSVILIIKGVGRGGVPVGSDTLEFWGVFDDASDFRLVIQDFESQTGTKVRYTRFPFEEYERSLLDALAAGTGPDIFMIHNTWMPKHADKVKPMPEEAFNSIPLMTIAEFREQFVDVAYDDLVFDDNIFALPLYMDTLALYYNKDLFNTAGIAKPPKNWDEFNESVEKLTRLDSRGNIIQAGSAIGTSQNINRSTDILSALIQSGVQMTDRDNSTATFSLSVNNTPVGDVALQYYTDFANPQKQLYTWNDNYNYSIDGFVQGNTAMMFNYSHQIDILRGKAPRLNFTVAPMPQISETDTKTYANYWAVAVANSSDNYDNAWLFNSFLTSKDGMTVYLNETARPSARRDIINLQRSDVDLGVFAVQALSAKSWFQADNTAIETIFSDMIDDVNFNRASVTNALRAAENKVNILMRQKKI